MRILQFVVDGQKLSKDGDFSNIVKGTKGYLKCRFLFKGNDWNGYKAAVAFVDKDKEYAAAIGSDGSCQIPDEVTGLSCFKVKMVGVRGDRKIITNTLLVEQEG